jgi:hypothetical protein
VRLVFFALAAALVVAAGTGCSSDDSESGSTAAPTTTTTTTTATTEPAETRPEPPAAQSRWAAGVDDACTPWQERIEAVTPPADAGDLQRYLEETLPLIRKQVAAVAAVPRPAAAGDSRQVKHFVAALRKLEDALTRYVAALGAADADATKQALADANAAGVEARGSAVTLDVTECGGYAGS